MPNTLDRSPGRRSALRPVLLALTLAGTTALAGCGDDTPPVNAGDFPPLHYGYLPPLRLNVSSIDVENQAPPSELASRSPVLPSDALANMARDRLQPAGPTGTAVFTITDAGIDRTDEGLTEHLAAHVDIIGASGSHDGFAEARVQRSVSGDEAVIGPASLYALTRQAMQDMNVEFEYQVRAHLADWLVTPGAAVEAPVSQAPLTGGTAPGAPNGVPVGAPVGLDTGASAPLPLAPGSAPSGGPTELAPPINGAAGGGGAPPTDNPQLLSPPPGDLAPPPGAAFAPPSAPPAAPTEAAPTEVAPSFGAPAIGGNPADPYATPPASTPPSYGTAPPLPDSNGGVVPPAGGGY